MPLAFPSWRKNIWIQGQHTFSDGQLCEESGNRAPGLKLVSHNCLSTEHTLGAGQPGSLSTDLQGRTGNTIDGAFILERKLPILEINNYCQNVLFDFIIRRKFSLCLE